MLSSTSNNSLPSSLPPELKNLSYLTERQVSELTGRALQTLRNDRFRGRGFPYVKMGKSVRYKLIDVLSAMENYQHCPGSGRKKITVRNLAAWINWDRVLKWFIYLIIFDWP